MTMSEDKIEYTEYQTTVDGTKPPTIHSILKRTCQSDMNKIQPTHQPSRKKNFLEPIYLHPNQSDLRQLNDKYYHPRFVENKEIVTPSINVNEKPSEKLKTEELQIKDVNPKKKSTVDDVDLTLGQVLKHLKKIIWKNKEEIRLNLFLVALVLLMLVPSILFAVLNEPDDPYQYEMTSYATVWPVKHKLVLHRGKNQNGPKLQINWGNTQPPLIGVPYMCKNQKPWCYSWPQNLYLLLTPVQPVVGVDCIKFKWQNMNKQIAKFSDYFLMDNNEYWYGGPAGVNTIWPINSGDINIGDVPLLTGDVQTNFQNLYGVQEPFWVSSAGFAVVVSKHYPMRINQTKSMTCISSDSDSAGTLQYAVCRGSDPASLVMHRGAIESSIFDIGKPKNVSANDDESKQLDNQYVKNDTVFNILITLDARNLQSQDVTNLITVLDSYNLSSIVMFEYFDFFDQNMSQDLLTILRDTKLSSYYSTAVETNNFVKVSYVNFNMAFWTRICVLQSPTGIRSEETPSSIGTVIWRGLLYFVIDFTDTEVRLRFFDIVKEHRIGNAVQYFGFAGGTAEELPIEPELNVTSQNLNLYSTYYAESVSMVPSAISISAGYGTQHLDLHIDVPVAVQNVTSIIPLFLTLNIQGYSYLILHLFDQENVMNSFYSNRNNNYTHELKQWLQIAMYLPVFRLPSEILQITTFKDVYNKHESIRRNTVLPHYIKAANNHTLHGYPIIKPIWWSGSSNQKEVWIRDNQYMIGDDLVIAAFLDQQPYSFTVYLPEGTWQDPKYQGLCHKGGQLITIHSPTDIICFERVLNDNVCHSLL